MRVGLENLQQIRRDANAGRVSSSVDYFVDALLIYAGACGGLHGGAGFLQPASGSVRVRRKFKRRDERSSVRVFEKRDVGIGPTSTSNFPRRRKKRKKKRGQRTRTSSSHVAPIVEEAARKIINEGWTLRWRGHKGLLLLPVPSQPVPDRSDASDGKS